MKNSPEKIPTEAGQCSSVRPKGENSGKIARPISLSKTLSQLSAVKQKRLDTLMAKNNEGKLTEAEQRELRELVDEAETIMLSNARVLKQQHRRLTADSKQ